MEPSAEKKTTIADSRTGLHINVLDLLILFVSLISSVVFLAVNQHSYYNAMTILPALFGLCYIILGAPIIRNTRSKTMIVFSLCEFARCVVLPLAVAFLGYSGFAGGRFSTTDASLIWHAVLLMGWEMIAIYVFLAIYIKNHPPREYAPHEVRLAENKYAIYLIIVVGIVIYAASSSIREYVNFLFLKSSSDKVRGIVAGSTSTLFTGLVTYVHIAFLCIFILILDWCATKCESSRKNRRFYVLLATIAGLITVSVIFGESRAMIVYTLFAVVVCLMLKFKDFKRTFIPVLSIMAVVVMLGMTVYRLFAVYNFSSYSAAIEQGGYMGQNYLSEFLESYLLGPQTMAAGIEFKELHSGSFTIQRLFFDIFRPFMGFNLILKNFSTTTSITLYNSWLFDTAGRSNGCFLQITSQGYCYFGFLLSPLFACFFMWLSIKLEDWVKRTRNLFLVFFFSYVFIRTSTCVLGGTMSGYITAITMTALVCGAFFLMQKAFGSLIKDR